MSQPLARPSEGAPDETVQVRIAVGGVELSFRGRKAFFDQHIAPLMEAAYARAGQGMRESEAEPASAAIQGTAFQGAEIQGAVFQPASPDRFQKFAGQVGANAVTVEQRAMAFAFYLWNYERRDEFSRDDIASFFRTVKEEPPDELDTLLQELSASKRFLEARSGTDAMCLTTKGVNYVKNRLLGAI